MTYVGCAIEIWDQERRETGRDVSWTIDVFEEVELPPVQEVDAWEAVEELEAESAAAGGVPPWPSVKDTSGSQAGVSRPATVSAVAVLLAALAVVHALGGLGSLSLGLDGRGIGSAVIAGGLALIVGVAEVVCAVQVTRGRSWARIAAAALGLLVLLWLTMAPWSPGTLTVIVFAAWLAVGALLAHPLTSRFFDAVQPVRA
jgi:hypothetical protein